MGILDLVFPESCLGCGKEGSYICTACLSKSQTPRSVCPACERPSVDGMTHFKCRKPFGLDGLVSIWSYGGVIRKAILTLKYKFAYEVAKELAKETVTKLMSYQVIKSLENPILVPVPIHWLRGNWRGFNQSEEIGRLVAEKMHWKFYPDFLIRKKLATPQTELKGKERSGNIRGVFKLNSRYQLTNSLINQLTFILFDDVWTTGSTLKEAAKVLKRKGAKIVWGLTITR